MNNISENTNHDSIPTHSDSDNSQIKSTDISDIIKKNEKYNGPRIMIEKDSCSYFRLALCEWPDSFGAYCINLFTGRYFH